MREKPSESLKYYELCFISFRNVSGGRMGMQDPDTAKIYIQ